MDDTICAISTAINGAISIVRLSGADSISIVNSIFTEKITEESHKIYYGHIKDEDVYALSQSLKTRLNLEMAMADDIQAIALDVKPYSICLVPEKRQEVTTEGGLDVAGQLDKVTEFIKPLLDAGIIVSLFIDPDEEQVRASAKTGAQFIEMHTGAYAENFGYKEEEEEFQKLKKSAELAQSLDLQVNAGHGLNYENVHRMHEIKGLHELNIGHSIISRAVFTGLPEAVSKMKEMIK